MISIIIPAHNEAAVIGRCLSSLLNGAGNGELEIIVVANGCTDGTADVARRFGPSVRVIDTPVASKPRALNLGDKAATGFPRFYVDADVVLNIDAIRQLAARLERDDCVSVENPSESAKSVAVSPPHLRQSAKSAANPTERAHAILAAAPRGRFQLDGCTWAVRAYYDIYQLLPSSRDGIGGSGVYALSAQGRARFGEFPPIVADDGFVRLQFRPEERVTLETCYSLVFAPKTLRELVKIKTRSHYGSWELRKRYPELWKQNGPRGRSALRRLFLRPCLWPKLAVYGYVKIAARLRCRRIIRNRVRVQWERDETSRMPARSARASESGSNVYVGAAQPAKG